MTSTARSALAVLRGVFDEHGWRWGTLYLVHRLLSGSTRGAARLVPYAFVAQPIGLAPFAALRDDPRTVVRRIDPTDAVAADFPRPPAENRRRHDAGAECYVVEVNRAFAGHLWLSRGAHAEDEVRCDYHLLPAGVAVWDFDVYIAPAHRLGRTMARLWKGVNSALVEQHVAWSLSRISLFNRASLKAHERLGAVRLSTAVFLVVGPVQWAFFSSAPFVHLSTRPAHRPVVKLQAPGPA